MLVNELLSESKTKYINVLHDYCMDFIHESGGKPLYRNLPTTYDDFKKVKVRKKKNTNSYSSVFNEAFKVQLNDLKERSIFASSKKQDQSMGYEPFYVFPIDGYNFIYDKKIKKTTDEYEKELVNIISEMNNTSKDILTDLIKLSYTSNNLVEGIEAGAEIIIYGIPYFYAVRVSSVPDYDDMVKSLLKMDME